MRWVSRAGAVSLTLCAFVMVGLSTIAITPAADETAEPTVARISAVEADPSPMATSVRLVADKPLSYTSYDPDAGTLVIECPGSETDEVEQTFNFDAPQIDRVVVSRFESSNGTPNTRFEFQGRQALHTRIEPVSNGLLVVFEGSGNDRFAISDPVETPSGDETAQQWAAEAVAADVVDATILSTINIHGSEESPVVTMAGDGLLHFEVFELDSPDRVVIDFSGVKNEVAAKAIPVGAHAVEQVRVSQFKEKPEKVARVVFDLNRQDDYLVEQEGNTVTVRFTGPRAEEVAAVDITPAEMHTIPQPPAPVVAPKHDPVETVSVKNPVQPAAVDMAELGQDVVLFDKSQPRQVMQASNSGMDNTPNLTTLPKSLFESKTIAGGRPTYRGEKISVAFRDADLREVMFFFADVMKMNIILDPDITGKVDIKLNQVPWDQAFQVILKNQGLQAVEEQNVIRIAKTTRLRQEAADQRSLKQAEEQAVDPVTFTRTLSYAKASEAMQVLQSAKLENGRAKVVADIRTNTLIISDIPKNRSVYEGLLDTIDTQTPQVIIEARIVEAFRTFERDLGINWALAGRATPDLGTQTNVNFPHTVDFVADVNTAPTGFPSAGGIGLMLGNVLDSVTLDVSLEALESDGRLRILSSPKVTTQNNQSATIEQGTQIPVVTTTATEVDVQFVPASLRLIVTPQITAEDTVIMKLRVENNQPSTTVSVADVPGISTESVDTQILVRTGTTAVIGGIYKLTESDTTTGIPGLRKIPFLGWLFKNKVTKKDSAELLVFITPKIVKNI